MLVQIGNTRRLPGRLVNLTASCYNPRLVLLFGR
jgi:hypothetical protein